jgi:2,4-dienoyl-CoA reductase (NADPH2)
VFGSELGLPGRFRLVADVEALGVRLAGRAVIASIGAGAVQVSVGDVLEEIKADSVIVASGAVPDTSLVDALHDAGIAVRAVGDCRTIGRIEGANLDAAAVALAIG